MNFISRKPFDPSLHKLTDESVYRNRGLQRREFLAEMGRSSLGLGAAGLLLGGSLPGCGQHKPDEQKLKAAAQVDIPKAAQSHYPAKRNPVFEYGRDETDQQAAAIYTNFYEFSTSKQTYLYVDDFKPTLAVKYPLAPGQLVGVIEIVKKSEFTDFRGQDVAAGVYTLRYGQQPVDGNHVGTSDLADFLLAIPAKLDTDPALLKMSEAMHKLSAKTAGSNHPAIFSLLPPKADEKTPALTHDSSKHFWILSITADGKAGDAAIKIPLRVVMVGVSEG